MEQHTVRDLITRQSSTRQRGGEFLFDSGFIVDMVALVEAYPVGDASEQEMMEMFARDENGVLVGYAEDDLGVLLLMEAPFPNYVVPGDFVLSAEEYVG